VPNVQWETPDDGQRKYPKNVDFLDKNKFVKLVHLVGCIIKKFVTMQHGHMNVKFVLEHSMSRQGFEGGTAEHKSETYVRFCDYTPIVRTFIL
jgi:hypothetical protein